MSKQASELKDLDVDRVDGVDKPATGRNFLLFKSEGGAAAIMKSYGAVATAGDLVLKAIRTDKNAVVSRKSAIALNGLAQILGQDAVFVGKSVPTQPYEIKENVDGDARGPADEDLGGNFTPRSMPGSMVGSVQFRMKDADEDADDAKVSNKEKAGYDADEDDKKAKAAGKGKGKAKDADADADDEMGDDEKKQHGAAAKAADARLSKMEDAIAKLAGLVTKAIEGPQSVTKSEDEPVVRPRSKQIDDEPVRVRKGQDAGYESRFGVSFADTVFGK